MMAAGPEVAPTSGCQNLDFRSLCCCCPPLCEHVRESPQISTMFQPSDNVPGGKQAYDVAECTSDGDCLLKYQNYLHGRT